MTQLSLPEVAYPVTATSTGDDGGGSVQKNHGAAKLAAMSLCWSQISKRGWRLRPLHSKGTGIVYLVLAKTGEVLGADASLVAAFNEAVWNHESQKYYDARGERR